jgi:hypothetical protein
MERNGTTLPLPFTGSAKVVKSLKSVWAIPHDCMTVMTADHMEEVRVKFHAFRKET